jgi:dGTPase
VQDVITTSGELIEKAGVRSADEVRRQNEPLIRYSRSLLAANRALRKFLYKNLYYHPTVATANERACGALKDVFEAYLKMPSLLGETTSKRIRKEGLHRTVCDYLSGMTDRYLLDEHQRLRTTVRIEPVVTRPVTRLSRRRE